MDMFPKFLRTWEKSRSKHGEGSNRVNRHHKKPYSQTD